MRQLLILLARYRNFFLFLILEAIAVTLIIGNNTYQSAAFFTLTNAVVAAWNDRINAVKQYLYLQKRNEVLAEENALLLKRLTQRAADSRQIDSLYLNGYGFITARVIQNTTAFQNNFFIIDKGTNDGVEPGMGIITANGVAGKVKSCTQNAALAYSFLHGDLSVSVRIKRLGTIGTLKWSRGNITEADLLYVSQHEKVALGDTVVTAGFNTVYPPDLPVGIVSHIDYNASPTSGNAFLDLKVRLNINYADLGYVYVVKHKAAREIKSLQNQTALPQAD